jgi:Uma2 family endonuclease
LSAYHPGGARVVPAGLAGAVRRRRILDGPSADTSEDFDRRAKLPRYAQAGIPEAWLIVLSGRAVDGYNDPSPDGYCAHQRFGSGELVTSRQFPALNVPVSELV